MQANTREKLIQARGQAYAQEHKGTGVCAKIVYKHFQGDNTNNRATG